MEEQGIIGPADGARPRDVLISSLDDLGGAPAEQA
jgi:S-DNA-T family DNA segregation ATPase FtsK/SpoIIIE